MNFSSFHLPASLRDMANQIVDMFSIRRAVTAEPPLFPTTPSITTISYPPPTYSASVHSFSAYEQLPLYSVNPEAASSENHARSFASASGMLI